MLFVKSIGNLEAYYFVSEHLGIFPEIFKLFIFNVWLENILCIGSNPIKCIDICFGASISSILTNVHVHLQRLYILLSLDRSIL